MYLPTDETLIPVGEPDPVAGTPMDFQEFKRIGAEIKEDFPALNFGKGYDNCWMINGYEPGQLQSAAKLYSPQSGRMLEVLTTPPATGLLVAPPGNVAGATSIMRAWRLSASIALTLRTNPSIPLQSFALRTYSKRQ